MVVAGGDGRTDGGREGGREGGGRLQGCLEKRYRMGAGEGRRGGGQNWGGLQATRKARPHVRLQCKTISTVPRVGAAPPRRLSISAVYLA